MIKLLFFLSVLLICQLGIAQRKVGIGTNSPVQRLSVDSTLNIDQGIYNNGTRPSLFFGTSTTTGIGSNQSGIGDNLGGIEFYTNGLPRLSLTNNGGLGIGRRNPTQALVVRGNIMMDVDTGCFIGCISSASLLFGNGSGAAYIISNPVNSFGAARQLEFYTGGNFTAIMLENGNMGIGNNNPAEKLDITGNTKVSGNGTFGGNLVVPAGKIGVGLSSPTSKLEIRDGALGLSSSTKTWELSYDNTNGNFYIDELGVARRFYIKNGGNVGIANNNPSERLDVTGNAKFSGTVSVQNGNGIVRNTGSTQLKTSIFNVPINGPLAAGATTVLGITFPEGFSANPAVYVAGLNASGGSGGHAECVYNISNISTSGCSLYIYNPRGSTATFASGFTITINATGAQ